MDLQAMMDPWTEERHASFLNSMEESFVRCMLASLHDGAGSRWWRRRLPLGRRLPDSATESTSDRKTTASTAVENETVAKLGKRSRTRKPSLLRSDDSQDQVVPEFGSTELDSSDDNNRDIDRGIASGARLSDIPPAKRSRMELLSLFV